VLSGKGVEANFGGSSVTMLLDNPHLQSRYLTIALSGGEILPTFEPTVGRTVNGHYSQGRRSSIWSIAPG
jgi:hypothetical protein